MNPLVSVIVAARDEARHIGQCLTALETQTYDPLEIVVVDDGSRDRTSAIARQVAGVHLLRSGGRGAGDARNLGAANASGDIFVFVDADMVVAHDFVERLVDPIVRDEVVGTFTKDIRVANVGSRWARAHMLGRNLPVDNHFRPDFPERWEIFRAITREAFESVAGFDEIGYGEDVTLGRKLGLDALAAPGATCWHYEPDSPTEILRTAIWYGRGARLTELAHPWRAHTLWSPVTAVRLALRHRWPLLVVYRLLWDGGVVFGLITRRRTRRKP